MKIGDKVKIVGRDRNTLPGMVGLIGMVGKIMSEGVDGHGTEGFRVLVGEKPDWFWCASSLELVEGAMPALALGDHVRVKSMDVHSSEEMRSLIGTSATISRISKRSSGETIYWLQQDVNPLAHQYYYLGTSLEKIGDATRDDVKRTPETKCADLAAAYGAAPKVTHSATIVLASGREVAIPDPNPEVWEQDVAATQRFGLVHEVSVRPDHSAFHVRATSFSMVHDEALCWASDMARIVNEKDVRSPFETRFSHVTEVRVFHRLPPKTLESYECVLPSLKTLW
jgi:hypothetical protein